MKRVTTPSPNSITSQTALREAFRNSAARATFPHRDERRGALDAKRLQAVVPLIGYLDRFSARPGERIAVKVSSQSDHPYQADLVRIIHADANPAGPGIKLEEIAADFAGAYVSRFQPVHLGSCGVVTPAEPITLP